MAQAGELHAIHKQVKWASHQPPATAMICSDHCNLEPLNCLELLDWCHQMVNTQHTKVPATNWWHRGSFATIKRVS